MSRLILAASIAVSVGLAGCGSDDCDTDSDCGDDEVCVECNTALDSCDVCVEAGSVEVCNCL